MKTLIYRARLSIIDLVDYLLDDIGLSATELPKGAIETSAFAVLLVVVIFVFAALPIN